MLSRFAIRALVLPSLLLSTRVPAQDLPAVPTDLARCLRDLGDDERALDAVRVLVRRGDAAVAALMTAIETPHFRDDPDRMAAAVYALGKLGDTAAPAAKLLLDELHEASDPVARNIFWALGEVGPKAQADGMRILDALVEARPAPGWNHQEWAFACRRIELGLDVPLDELEKLFQTKDHGSLVAAAGVVLRFPAGSDRVPADAVAKAWERVRADWAAYGEGHRRVALELARAVARHAPDSTEADLARAALLQHHDVEIRVHAAMQLGQHAAADPSIPVRALRAALGDGSVLVRREAVTALGLLGASAVTARPDLESLREDPDAQIRARAAAALRALDKAEGR